MFGHVLLVTLMCVQIASNSVTAGLKNGLPCTAASQCSSGACYLRRFGKSPSGTCHCWGQCTFSGCGGCPEEQICRHTGKPMGNTCVNMDGSEVLTSSLTVMATSSPAGGDVPIKSPKSCEDNPLFKDIKLGFSCFHYGLLGCDQLGIWDVSKKETEYINKNCKKSCKKCLTSDGKKKLSRSAKQRIMSTDAPTRVPPFSIILGGICHGHYSCISR
mmetsp:Transcript_31792/g.63007  ORF Transcript_31792/g.63007 Transcript_31792/m.63007 type:complete len:216 (+) Transcript_31792:109-756(+)